MSSLGLAREEAREERRGDHGGDDGHEDDGGVEAVGDRAHVERGQSNDDADLPAGYHAHANDDGRGLPHLPGAEGATDELAHDGEDDDRDGQGEHAPERRQVHLEPDDEKEERDEERVERLEGASQVVALLHGAHRQPGQEGPDDGGELEEGRESAYAEAEEEGEDEGGVLHLESLE